jgi:hypothetical protein
MGDGHIYCSCGHAIVSHDPANTAGFVCCIRGCGCSQFTRRDDGWSQDAFDAQLARADALLRAQDES